MKAKLGIYLPVYGGWVRNAPYEEGEVTYEYVEKVALKAEEIGIDSVWVPDHLLNPIKGEMARSLEAWTTLTAIAAATEKVELFHTCVCQAFRYPGVLAKMCATIADISKGRFRFVLGAGWFKREFDAHGIPWHEHDERVDRGREQIEIIRRFWTEPRFSYKGRFYEIVDGVMEPKPEKMPAVWWAGESERSRALIADLADGWLMRNADIQTVTQRIDDMKIRLQERGRKPIQYAMPSLVFADETDEKALGKLSALVGGDVEILNSVRKSGFVGCPETIVEKVKRLDESGLDYIIFQTSPAFELLKIIGEQILPCL